MPSDLQSDLVDHLSTLAGINLYASFHLKLPLEAGLADLCILHGTALLADEALHEQCHVSSRVTGETRTLLPGFTVQCLSLFGFSHHVLPRSR